MQERFAPKLGTTLLIGMKKLRPQVMSEEIHCLPQEEGPDDFVNGAFFSDSSFCFTPVLAG